VRTRLRPTNYNIHRQGRGAWDYCLRLVQAQPQLLSEDGRQIERACISNAFRRNSVDVSRSTSVEVVELVVQAHILGHSFRHTRYPLIYSFGVLVTEVVFREKLRTKDEISRRNMNFAAIARNNQKETENLRSQPSRSISNQQRHKTAAACRRDTLVSATGSISSVMTLTAALRK